jgi:hypothetical protein
MAKKKTVVRGSDGKLYRLSKTDPLDPVPDDQAKEVEDALPKLEKKLEGILAQDMANVAASCNQHVRIIIPDVEI